MVDCCRLLGVRVLCSCICPSRSGHDVPVNLQQDKGYSLFCSFLSLYEWKSVIPLEVRALRMGYPVYQGSPTPGPWTGTRPWPVRNRATQQEEGGRQASKASSVFTATPYRSHYCLSSASCQISCGVRFS